MSIRYYKNELIVVTGIPGAILHILVGLGIYIAVWLFLRSPRAALFAVLLAQLANEANDLLATRGNLPAALLSSLVDTLLTLAVPLLLYLIQAGRLLPSRRRSES